MHVGSPVEINTARYHLSATDWALRAGVALAFAIFAAEKLWGSGWVTLFDAIDRGRGSVI